MHRLGGFVAIYLAPPVRGSFSIRQAVRLSNAFLLTDSKNCSMMLFLFGAFVPVLTDAKLYAEKSISNIRASAGSGRVDQSTMVNPRSTMHNLSEENVQ